MNTKDSITIGDITIHQSENGLYLLTDLWKASGSARKDRPEKWLNLVSTQRYLKFLEKQERGNLQNEDVTKTGSLNKSSFFEIILGKGKPQGTYVSKELVYSYAMWVSCEYHHLVVSTFDALQQATTTQQLIDIKTALDNTQSDMFRYREPNDVRTLSHILKIPSSKCKPYYDHLVSIGELAVSWFQPKPIAVYHGTEKSRAVVGRKGKTVLFDDSVTDLIPAQTDWTV